MLPWLKKHEGPVVAAGSLIWFAVLTPWGRFADPDAFYHARLARLMLDRGPLQSFPWLDLTSLGRHFADQHYLFHLILGPFIAAAEFLRLDYAELLASQLAAPLLATLTVMALWIALKTLGIKSGWIWIALALLIPGFSMRLLLAKASPLAVGLFIVILGAMALRRPAVAFFAGALFALAHGGWIIAIMGAVAMLAGDVIARRLIQDENWEIALRDAPWSAYGGLLTGIALGLVIHPNRLTIFQFLWVQTFKAGLLTPNAVTQGREWLPSAPEELLAEAAPLVIAGLLGGLGLIMARSPIADCRNLQIRSRNSGLDLMSLTISLSLPAALTVALTLKSARFIEYLVPALVLWMASLWRFVDAPRLWGRLMESHHDLAPWMRRVIVPFLILLGATLAAHHASDSWRSLRREAKTFDAYRKTFSAISARANPGDRVFHSDWDEFPLLFAADDRLRYISGLDPTFLYEASSTLSDAVRDLTIGRATTTAWSIIAERTGSRFVFVTTKRHPDFDAALRTDARFKELARDETTAAYEVIGD